jgi:N-acetyl-gamma-glutamyl-phosphate reductase
MTIRTHLVGAAGYAAADLVGYLARHPHAEIVTLESQSAAGSRVCDQFPQLPNDRRSFEGEGTALARVQPGEIVFLCGERETARDLAPKFLAKDARVIDLSDAFRLHSHAGEAVYGFPERYRAQIAQARLVANPGCYPTAALLALLPFAPFASNVERIVIDAKSGITGAGRKPALNKMLAEVEADVHAYGLESHRHQPEIGQELAAVGVATSFIFSPHVVPFSRGILADCYVMGRTPFDLATLQATFERAYASNPFVHVLDGGRVPYLPALAHTNDAQIALAVRDGIAHVMCGIDNLGKGTSGVAVQNMNIMCGLEEELGLGARTTVV